MTRRTWLGAAWAAPLVLLAFAAPVRAQAPPPASPPLWELLTRYDFHLSAAVLTSGDPRFDWDASFGGELEAVRYPQGRAIFAADYNVVLGDELRHFDPNQGNYTFDLSGSRRYRHAEVHGLFHHTSRHLSDRPKTDAIDWNAIGVRATRDETWRGIRLKEAGSLARVLKRSFVDYTWLFAAETSAQFKPRGRVTPIGAGRLTITGVDRSVADRGAQVGVYLEGGARIDGVKGAMEFFGAIERRVDASPLERTARAWALIGFRLVNKD